MHNKILLSIVLCFTVCGLPTLASEVKDTLYSDTHDKICLTYEVDYQGDDVTVTFIAIKKYLSDSWNGQYELSKVKLLFFEREGDIKENFTGSITPKALRLTTNEMVYEYSDDGYVWIEANTQLRLRLLTDEAILSLPLYLVNYEKKYKYKIIADCGLLKIHLKESAPDSRSRGSATTSQEVISATEEVLVESANEDYIAESLLARMENSLQREITPDDLSYLKDDCKELRRLDAIITDSRLKVRIADMLQRIKEIEKEIADDNIQIQISQQLKDAQNNMDYLNERLDNIDNLSESDLAELKTLANDLRRKSKDVKGIGSPESEQLADKMVKAADRCDAEMKKTEDAKKRRSLWLIIGGILLVVLMFVGNQVFQHIRNMRNQKSIKDMQDKMAKQAKDETRRRIRNTVRSNVNHAESAIKQRSRNTVRNGLNNGVNSIIKKKGNKGFTV